MCYHLAPEKGVNFLGVFPLLWPPRGGNCGSQLGDSSAINATEQELRKYGRNKFNTVLFEQEFGGVLRSQHEVCLAITV